MNEGLGPRLVRAVEELVAVLRKIWPTLDSATQEELAAAWDDLVEVTGSISEVRGWEEEGERHWSPLAGRLRTPRRRRRP